LFITGPGMILYNTGNYIRLVNENSILFPNRDWVNVEFAGALIATFSWVSGYDECEMYSVQFIITKHTTICIPSKAAMMGRLEQKSDSRLFVCI